MHDMGFRMNDPEFRDDGDPDFGPAPELDHPGLLPPIPLSAAGPDGLPAGLGISPAGGVA